MPFECVQACCARRPPDCSAHFCPSCLRVAQAWVAKHIEYSFQDKSDLASDTLRKRLGMCTNKATLQIALLRALGIPAGYCVVHIYKSERTCTLMPPSALCPMPLLFLVSSRVQGCDAP